MACLLAFGAAEGSPRPVVRHLIDLRVPVVAELVSAGDQLLTSDSSGLDLARSVDGHGAVAGADRAAAALCAAEGDLLILTGWAEAISAIPASTETVVGLVPQLYLTQCMAVG